MKDLNPMMDEIITIEEYPANLNIVHMLGKRMFLVAARDFVCIGYVTMNSSTGCIEKIGASVEDSRCPPSSKFIRGEIKISGLRLKPNSDGGSDILVLSMSDPKGSIPGFLKSGASKKQPERIETALKAYYKKIGKQ